MINLDKGFTGGIINKLRKEGNMKNRFTVIIITMAMLLSLSFLGCKGKVEQAPDTQSTEIEQGAAITSQATDTLVTTEPAQGVATETIPPTASAQITPKPYSAPTEQDSRGKDIQTALKNAGFYAGAIDGKVGPKTKKAIEDFQKTHGLKVDGKVGPKTWAELEKYLVPQQQQ